MRCNPDGSRDGSFGNSGIVQTNPGFTGTPAVQSDGKIVLGGFVGTTFRVARLNADGSPDTSFDGDGIASAELPPNPGLLSIAVQPDGKIVGGRINRGDFALVRFNPDGSADTTFDGDGKLTSSIFAGEEAAYSVVLQPDGKILAAGYSLNSGFIYFGGLRSCAIQHGRFARYDL